MLREKTLISVLTFVPKLSDRTINGELLRYLAKTANDEQPGIRTNTTICLGKLAKSLGTSTRSKVLIAAFTRSLRDPFVHARHASLSALAATAEYFSEEDCASKLLPAICPLLLDQERPVREQASKTLEVFMIRVRKAASSMSDSALPPPQTPGDAAAVPRMSTPQSGGPPGSSSAAGGWAGWAISSFTNSISAVAGEMATQGDGTPSASVATPDAKKSVASSSASALHRQALASPTSTPALSRTSSQMASVTADAFLHMADNDDNDGWGAFGNDEGDEHERVSAANDASSPTMSVTSRQSKQAPARAMHTGLDDESEPDFAGWLAAQTAKKTTTSKGRPLPKGMTKATSSTSTSTLGPKKPSSTSVPRVAKKVDLKPKEPVADGDGDDGWGDGW